MGAGLGLMIAWPRPLTLELTSLPLPLGLAAFCSWSLPGPAFSPTLALALSVLAPGGTVALGPGVASILPLSFPSPSSSSSPSKESRASVPLSLPTVPSLPGGLPTGVVQASDLPWVTGKWEKVWAWAPTRRATNV